MADFLENVDLEVEESTVSSTVVDSVTVAIAKRSKDKSLVVLFHEITSQ